MSSLSIYIILVHVSAVFSAPRPSLRFLTPRADNATTITLPPSTSNRIPVGLPGDETLNLIMPNGTDCSSTKFYDRQCWTVLKMNDWLPAWHEQLKPCTIPHGTNCMQDSEPWTTSFLRMYKDGSVGSECSELEENGCNDYEPSGLAMNDPPLLRARYRYGQHAIILVGHFFETWFAQVQSAMNQATDLIKTIIDTISLPYKTHLFLNIFMTLLSFGLMFLPGGSEVSNLVGNVGTKVIDNVENGIKMIPDISKQIWPQKTKDDKEVQADDLISKWASPGGTIDEVKGRLGDTLKIAQGNDSSKGVQPFLAFVSHGDFATEFGDGPSLKSADEEQNILLLQAFTTFLVSTALTKNDWKTLAIPGLDMSSLQNGTKPCPQWASGDCSGDGGIHWCNHYDEQGLCAGTYWWYSQNHDTMYTIVKGEKLHKEDETNKIIQTILSKKWSTGQMLFENAAICEYLTLFPAASLATYLPLNLTNVPPTPAGIAYIPPYPDMDPYSVPLNATHRFMALNSPALVELSKRKDYDARFDRQSPAGETPFGVVPDGSGAVEAGVADIGETRCLSQMRTIVATKWKDKNWRKGSGNGGHD